MANEIKGFIYEGIEFKYSKLGRCWHNEDNSICYDEIPKWITQDGVIYPVDMQLLYK